MRKKLYVDENLVVTSKPRRHAAIVNLVNGCVEIAFIKPIAHHQNIAGSWCEKGKWNMRCASSYKASLPRLESCINANKGHSKPLFFSCYTASDSTDSHGRRDFWYALDEKGHKCRGTNAVVENVYVALLLTKEEFLSINPDIHFEDYDMSEC